MKNVSRAFVAQSLKLTMVGLFTLSALNTFAQELSREEQEIGSWSLTDVTEQYPGINDHYQDSISTCGESNIGEPLPTPQTPGVLIPPGTGNNDSGGLLPNPILPEPSNPVIPNNPFDPPPSQGNEGTVIPGVGSGRVPWDPVVNPGMGGGMLNPDPTNPNDPVNGAIGAGIIVDVITNIGKRVWDLVNMGKPISHVDTNTAHGLPKGIKCWTELEGWSWPQSKVYNINYKNKLGATVVDYTYRISYIYGGNIEGVGQYLSNVQIVPVNLKVAWGYTMYSRAEVPTVFNVGSKKSPVAGMQVNVRWKIESSLMSNEQSHMFHVGGNNVFKKVEQ